MNKYNVLIIGAGNQGALADAPGTGNEEKIISFAHALKEFGANILFYDLNIDNDDEYSAAKKAARIWGGLWSDKLLIHYDHMTIDIVIIATPDNTHYDYLKLFANIGHNPKLVICEKPLCTDLQQAREIVQLYKKKNIPLMVDYTRNFIPYYEDLKRKYQAGEFGEIVSSNVVFNRGWIHTATHAISFLEWLFDGQYNGKIMKCETDYRIWQIDLYFEKYHWREERIGDEPVWFYYDDAMMHVISNAFEFLEGKEPIKCTGEDALKALEKCYELLGEK
jgi:predicted dehydrogenase